MFRAWYNTIVVWIIHRIEEYGLDLSAKVSILFTFGSYKIGLPGPTSGIYREG
jgi:hypothetical protein